LDKLFCLTLAGKEHKVNYIFTIVFDNTIVNTGRIKMTKIVMIGAGSMAFSKNVTLLKTSFY